MSEPLWGDDDPAKYPTYRCVDCGRMLEDDHARTCPFFNWGDDEHGRIAAASARDLQRAFALHPTNLPEGTTFHEVIEWRVVGDRVTGQPFARSNTAPWAKGLPAFDPSTIRDVTPPPARTEGEPK